MDGGKMRIFKEWLEEIYEDQVKDLKDRLVKAENETDKMRSILADVISADDYILSDKAQIAKYKILATNANRQTEYYKKIADDKAK